MVIEKIENENYLLEDSIHPELKEMFLTWVSGELYSKDFYRKMEDFWKAKGIYSLSLHVCCNNNISILASNCSTFNVPYPEEEDDDWKDIFDPIKDAFTFEIERLEELYDIINKAFELKDWYSYRIANNMLCGQVENVNLLRKLNNIIKSDLTTDSILNELRHNIPYTVNCHCPC